MKKIFTCLMMGLSTFAMAQKSGSTFVPKIHGRFEMPAARATDTVNLPPLVAACTPNAVIATLTNSGGGEVSGTNSFQDLEKAQWFNYTGGGDITGVLVFFGVKYAGTAAGTSNYSVKLYAGTSASTTAPGTLLGTSGTVAFTSIDTTGMPTHFPFSTPVAVSDYFFASAVVDDMGATGDTVGVFMVLDGSNISNACGNNTAWEKWSDNSWLLMSNTTSGWGLDAQFVIAPIISTVANVGEISALTTHKVYPNPASDLVNFSYSLNTSSDVKIIISDVAGKVLYTHNQPARFSGAYNHTVDVAGFAPGLYNYTIVTGGSTVSSKFMVR